MNFYKIFRNIHFSIKVRVDVNIYLFISITITTKRQRQKQKRGVKTKQSFAGGAFQNWPLRRFPRISHSPPHSLTAFFHFPYKFSLSLSLKPKTLSFFFLSPLLPTKQKRKLKKNGGRQPELSISALPSSPQIRPRTTTRHFQNSPKRTIQQMFHLHLLRLRLPQRRCSNLRSHRPPPQFPFHPPLFRLNP